MLTAVSKPIGRPEASAIVAMALAALPVAKSCLSANPVGDKMSTYITM
jgi:hypothetical protein